VGSHGSRIAVPAIAVAAVTAALALIASAPLILFPKETDDVGAIAPPPAASGEVGRVTAPALQPERTVSRPAVLPGSAVAPAEPAPLRVAFSPRTSPRGELNGDRPTGTGDARVERRVARESDAARGKVKGHARKDRETTGSQGKALGHLKDKARGNAYGHDKPGPPPVLSSTTPHGPKPHHVDPPGAGKHSGGLARAHARAGR
jgi:hypothetical protein